MLITLHLKTTIIRQEMDTILLMPIIIHQIGVTIHQMLITPLLTSAIIQMNTILLADYHTPDWGYHSPDANYTSPDNGYDTPGDGYHSPDADDTPDWGYHSPDANYTSPDYGYDTPGDGYHTPDADYHTPDWGYHSPDAKTTTVTIRQEMDTILRMPIIIHQIGATIVRMLITPLLTTVTIRQRWIPFS